jgi:hypothetical protein
LRWSATCRSAATCGECNVRSQTKCKDIFYGMWFAMHFDTISKSSRPVLPNWSRT